MHPVPLRSALYLPATNARAIAKARTLPCDVVILDLEDSVAPEAKAGAREQAIAAVAEGGFGRRRVVVRANALASEWGADDLVALAQAGADAVLLPKVSTVQEAHATAARLEGVPLWAMIETPRGVLDVAAIAGSGVVDALVLGINDLAKDMRARQTAARTPFLGFLATAVAAARANGLAVFDGVFNDLDDEAGLRAQCAQGAEFGFDGKTLIHPRQIVPCNEAFSPSAAEITDARAIEAAFARPEHAGHGVIRLDGRMVERLHLDQALRTLAIASAIEA